MANKKIREEKAKALNLSYKDLNEFLGVNSLDNLIEEFEDFIKKDSSTTNILRFLSLKSSQLVIRSNNLDSFSAEERKKLYEFRDYFMENYGEETYYSSMLNWGQEPLIFRLTDALYDNDCEKRDDEFMKSLPYDILEEAATLTMKLFLIKKDRVFSFMTSNNQWLFLMKKTIPKESLLKAQETLLISCAKVIANDGDIILRIIEKDSKDKMLGIVVKNHKWSPLSKKELEAIDKESQSRFNEFEDIEYIEIE